MRGLATVEVLRRHSNEFGEQIQKVPAAELAEGAAAVSSYPLPLDHAEMLQRQDLVKITAMPDPEPEPELPADMAEPKRGSGKKKG